MDAVGYIWTVGDKWQGRVPLPPSGSVYLPRLPFVGKREMLPFARTPEDVYVMLRNVHSPRICIRQTLLLDTCDAFPKALPMAKGVWTAPDDARAECGLFDACEIEGVVVKRSFLSVRTRRLE